MQESGPYVNFTQVVPSCSADEVRSLSALYRRTWLIGEPMPVLQ
jgi:hypothetical protein